MNQLIYWTSGRKGIYLSAAFLLALTIAAGCKKKTNTLGLGALDPNELLASGGVEMLDLITYTVEEDTMPTDNQLFVILGNYNDPKFGTFKSGFFTQYHLNGTLDFDGGTPILDSAVLSLAYRRSYGKLDEQKFQVYELGEGLHIDSTYYKHTTKAHTGSELVMDAYEDQVPNMSDSVLIAGDMRPPQLRLRLEDARFQTFLNDAVSTPSNFDTDAHFTEYFKGLHVYSDTDPSTGAGGVFSFNLVDPDTRLTIYYKIDGVQFSIELNAEASCADFNQVTVNNPSEITNTFENPLFGQTQYYAQAFKSRAKVDFPEVDNLPKNCIVHNALLVVPVSHQTSASYAPSVALSAGYKTDEDGIVGFQVIAYDETSKSYIIDVRDYLQDVVTGEAENRGVFLYPTFFSSTAERIIFNGRYTSNKHKPRLIVKYTEY